MKTLSTCLILTVFAVCNANWPFLNVMEKLVELTPLHTRGRLTADQHLRRAEVEIVDLLQLFGHGVCPKEQFDWEEAWNETVALNAAIDVEGETLCSLITNHIEDVLEPYWSRLDKCGHARHGRSFFRTIVLSSKSLVQHICSITGDQIIELFNPCTLRGKFTGPQCQQFRHEIKDRRSLRQQIFTNTTAAKELCRISSIGKDCYMYMIGQNCKLDFTKKAWEDLFNAILSPCSRIF